MSGEKPAEEKLLETDDGQIQSLKTDAYKSVEEGAEAEWNCKKYASKEAEIEDLKRLIKSCKGMFFLLSIASGTLMFITYPNFFYVKDTLKASPSQYTLFDTLTKTTWTFKAIVGYIEDTYFPFRYKVRSYVVLSCIGTIVFSWMIFLLKPGLWFFTGLVALIYLSVCIEDVMAEGLTAVAMNYEKRLKELERHKDEKDEKKNFGNFVIFRNLVRTVCIFLGGEYYNKMNIGVVYVLLSILPVFILLYAACGFKEDPRDSWVNKESNFRKNIGNFYQVMRRKEVLLPTILMMFVYSNPNLSDTGNYILTDENQGNWSDQDLSLNTLVSNLIYTAVMLVIINKIRGLRFSLIILMAIIGLNVTNLMNYSFVFIKKFTFNQMFALQLLNQVTQNFSGDMTIIPIVGRFSTLCPKGMENFGVTFIVSISVLGLTISGALGSYLLRSYGITSEDYSNYGTPVLIGCIYSAFVLVLTPIFAR